MLALAALLTLSGCATSVPIAGVDGQSPTSEPQSTRCAADYEIPAHASDGPIESDHIEYVPSDRDVEGEVTKFGGQPSWIEAPQWPINATTGEKMPFVGQVVIDSTLFPTAQGRMAYLFLQDTHDYSWDPYAGQNAVILQPGGELFIDVVADATGPNIEESTEIFTVETTRVTEPPMLTNEEVAALGQDEAEEMFQTIMPDKIGGTPDMFQGPEFADCGETSYLLYQVGLQPYLMNLGDGGVGFLLIDDRATKGRFLWQSH